MPDSGRNSALPLCSRFQTANMPMHASIRQGFPVPCILAVPQPQIWASCTTLAQGLAECHEASNPLGKCIPRSLGQPRQHLWVQPRKCMLLMHAGMPKDAALTDILCMEPYSLESLWALGHEHTAWLWILAVLAGLWADGCSCKPQGAHGFKWLGSLWHSQAFDAVWQWHCVVAMLHGILHYAKGQGHITFAGCPEGFPTAMLPAPPRLFIPGLRPHGSSGILYHGY